VVRAAADIAGDTVIYVLGSQAALAQFESLPAAMAASPELDLYPGTNPGMADVIDGNIGQGSLFHATHGYYADGVGPETATLPSQWKTRATS